MADMLNIILSGHIMPLVQVLNEQKHVTLSVDKIFDVVSKPSHFDWNVYYT